MLIIEPKYLVSDPKRFASDNCNTVMKMHKERMMKLL
jgi:hypothetical protein